MASFKDFFQRIGLSAPTSYRQWFFPITGSSFSFSQLSDAKAIKHGYMGNLNIYAIIKKASEGVATLPYALEKKNGENWEIVTDGDLHRFVFEPNDEQTLTDLLEASMVFYFANGEAYYVASQEAVGFNADQVYTIPPELMTPKLQDKNEFLSPVESYKFRDGNVTKTFMPSEVCHLYMFNPSVQGFKERNGLSPLQAAWNKLQASNNQATGQAEYFENRGISTIISSQGGNTGLMMTKEEKKNLDAGFRSRVGGAEKVNGVIVTPTPIQTSQLGSSASDMQMLEQGSALLRELCTAYFMPSEMFNDPENKTHANRKEAVKTLYNDVFIPNAERWLRSYNKKFVRPMGERLDGGEYRIRILKDEIDSLKPDVFEIRRQAREDAKAGIITRNEAREEIGYMPIEDEAMNTTTNN